MLGRTVSHPFVDFIRVKEEYRRKGVALALYEKAGKYLGNKGLTLKGSGLQRKEAASCWSKMHSLPHFPTYEIGKTARGIKYKLDYRPFIE